MYRGSGIYGAVGNADVVESSDHRITAVAETTPPVVVVLASVILEEVQAWNYPHVEFYLLGYNSM
jgi:hypothetical protein